MRDDINGIEQNNKKTKRNECGDLGRGEETRGMVNGMVKILL